MIRAIEMLTQIAGPRLGAGLVTGALLTGSALAGTLLGWTDEESAAGAAAFEPGSTPPAAPAVDLPTDTRGLLPQPSGDLDPRTVRPYPSTEGDTARGPLPPAGGETAREPLPQREHPDGVDVPPAPAGTPIPVYPHAAPVGPSVATGLAAGCPPTWFDGTAWRTGVACSELCGPCEPKWNVARPIPWQAFAQGEYVGPARLPHVPEYRLRVDDVVEFVYRLTRVKSTGPYRLNVGDTLRLESLTDATLNREVLVQPDGNITVPQLGQVPAAGLTISDLQANLESRREFVRRPSITITPTRLNTRLEELRATVDSRFGAGGQSRQVRVTPEGTVQLPAIGSVPAQGLSLDELKVEVEYRYQQIVEGLEVTPVLAQRAPRFIFVVGEVGTPGRITLEGPTTVMQAIAMAGNWNIGARLDHIVVLRRDENWNLMATRLELHNALFGLEPCPADEIWLRDSDVVIVPKRPIQWTGDLIELFFTRAIYRVLPVNYSVALRSASRL